MHDWYDDCFFFIISKSAFIWWKIINFQVKLYIMMAIWMQRTNNSRFSQQFRLSCKTQINTREHFVQSWFFYYLAKTKLLLYLGCTKLLSSGATTRNGLLAADLAKICQWNACKRLWSGFEIHKKKWSYMFFVTKPYFKVYAFL